MIRRRWFPVLAGAALAVSVAFLLLPIVAIFTHTAPGRLIDALDDPVATDALRLSLETTAISMALIVLVGTPDHWHCLPMVAACKAGADVYQQKPISYDIVEGQAMVENHPLTELGLEHRIRLLVDGAQVVSRGGAFFDGIQVCEDPAVPASWIGSALAACKKSDGRSPTSTEKA